MEFIRASSFHRRHGRGGHAFRYGVDCVLSSLEDRVEGARLMSRNRFNLFSLHDRHYGAGGEDAAEWAKSVLRDWGLGEFIDGPEAAAPLLLTQPRMLGMGFNPVSFWFFPDRSGALRAAIAEVNNTFGDRHSYICFHDDGRPIRPEDRLEARKVFHVSPFQVVDGVYSFKFDLGERRVGVWIDYERPGGGVFATLTGKREPLTDRALIATTLRRPLGMIRVLGLIHWRALILFFKGAAYRTRPEPPVEDVTR